MAQAEPLDFSLYDFEHKHDPLNLDRSDAIRNAGLALVRLARRSVIIVSRNLDERLYNNAEFITAVREFTLSSRHARLRILVRDSAPAVHAGHRLIELSQRLSSFVEIRNPDHQFASYNSAFLVADTAGYVYRELSDQYQAQCCFSDRKYSDELSRQFKDMWENSQPDINLRRMLM